MDLDFSTFQLKLLTSLTPNVPLDRNLRAVIAPVLHKLLRYCRAQVAVHVFVNPEVHEVHALVLGAAKDSLAAVRDEEERRDGPGNDLTPNPKLPEYIQLKWGKGDERDHVFSQLDAVEEEQMFRPVGQTKGLQLLLRELHKERSREFRRRLEDDDAALVLALRTSDHPRLGYFILWAPKEDPRLQQSFENARKQEGRVAIRSSVAALVIRLCSNFYYMAPEPYLPSYCRPETKPATVLCARLRGFDEIASCIRARKDLSDEQQSRCIRDLIRRFNETVAHLVRMNRGRVDQLLGDEILSVFGEYLDTRDETPRPGCYYALSTAAQIVALSRVAIKEWFESVFKKDQYFQSNSRHVEEVSVTVAVNHGEVMFDYVGSRDQVAYIALGEPVTLVRQLALARIPDPKPILLTASVESWSRGMLQDTTGQPSGAIHTSRSLSFPPRPEKYVIFLLEPENISNTAR